MSKPLSRMWADDTLRKAGFEIVARPAKGPPRWKRRWGRLVYDQPQALAIVQMERQRAKIVDLELATK